MTEAEWLSCTDPNKMLGHLRDKASDRKLRLFAVAYARRRFGNLESLEVAERHADGLADQSELRRSESDAYWYVVGNCTDIQGQVTDPRDWSLPAVADDNAAKAVRVIAASEEDARRVYENLGLAPEGSPLPALFREIFGNPFRPATVPPSWLAWNDGTVPKLAQAIYAGRAFDRLPILADALEDAGCTDAEILNHCRGPGPHVRGCWVVDLLLGKT